MHKVYYSFEWRFSNYLGYERARNMYTEHEYLK